MTDRQTPHDAVDELLAHIDDDLDTALDNALDVDNGLAAVITSRVAQPEPKWSAFPGHDAAEHEQSPFTSKFGTNKFRSGVFNEVTGQGLLAPDSHSLAAGAHTHLAGTASGPTGFVDLTSGFTATTSDGTPTVNWAAPPVIGG